MQQHNFKRNLIAASVAMTLGISGTTFAATSGQITPSDDSKPSISNVAVASYSVDGQEQTPVTSNEVTVIISPVAEFSLIAIQGSPNHPQKDEANEDQIATPGGTTEFRNKLINQGNESDTYTLTIDPNGDDTDIKTAKPTYQFTNVSKMTVKIYDADDQLQDTKTVENGQKVTLKPGEYADISYTATTPDNAKGGQDATLTLTATSEDITVLDNTKASLVNESHAFVQVPAFKIQKAAKSTAGDDLNRIDLNKTNKFTYKIVVTNDSTKDYTTDVVNALIQDTLPAGLDLDETAAVTRSPEKGELDTSKTTADGRRIVSLNKVNLAKGESVTITIPVKITDKDALETAGSVTNHAHVYDNYDDTPVNPENPDDADIHDSTDNDNDTPRVTDEDDDDTTVSLPTSKRSLTISDGTTKELPVTSAPNSPATYVNTVTNNGTEDETNLKFSITDTNGDKVDIIPGSVTFTPDGKSPIKLIEDPNNKGTYIPEDSSITITLPKDSSGDLTYKVASKDAETGNYPNVVDVIPSAGANDDAPEVEEKTNTTQVKTIDPQKLQVLDADCNGSPEQGNSFSKNPITDAKPGQCIIYKVQVDNPFTTKALTDVIISDNANNWSAGATYKTNSVSVSTDAQGTVTEEPSNNTGSVKANFATIPAGKNGWVKFSIQINP